MVTITAKVVYDELEIIKRDLKFIKTHMFDPDTIMTIEEAKRFEAHMKEFRKGKTAPLSKLKAELGL